MDLLRMLYGEGYYRIPLSASGLGHFHLAATVAGRPVSALLDTGATNTMLSLTLARELGFPLVTSGLPASGAGPATLDVFFVKQVAELSLGELRLSLQEGLTAMDFSHVNKALRDREAAVIELILGVDILQALKAIIDYGSSSLFLQATL
jgi:hypothetical protein